MVYIRLDLEDLAASRETVRLLYARKEARLAALRDDLHVDAASPRRTRRVLAVDSGLNSAYETGFTLFRAAVVDDALGVERVTATYLFLAANRQTDRMKRLILQRTLYEALLSSVEKGAVDDALVLVDGTITLTILYPTANDTQTYRRLFEDLHAHLYTPLVEKCLARNGLLLGFLKRTGSTYLAGTQARHALDDAYIMNALLRRDGQYIPPIPIADANAKRVDVQHRYVTFYVNLKGWPYRFELLQEQAAHHAECAGNLLALATVAHHGMNPIFSKADEYTRVSKREVNLKFDYVIHGLADPARTQLRLDARKRTHFGYHSDTSRRLVERRR